MLERLRERRKSAGLTQSDLAAKIGVTRRSIIRWENGQTKPNIKKVAKLAEVLKCQQEDLSDD